MGKPSVSEEKYPEGEKVKATMRQSRWLNLMALALKKLREEFGNKFEVREGRQESIDSLIQTLRHREFKERNDHPHKELHGK